MRKLNYPYLRKRFQLYENEIYRLVEGQSFIATRKLVDNDSEQDILEKVIDKSKPPIKTRNKRGELHYLLYTPFRYPPLKSGGRFHTRIEQGIFYGAEDLKTAMAEIAYGRLLFMRHSEAILEPTQVPYTHFVTSVKSNASILLTKKPFLADRNEISNPSSYNYSQLLGTAMRGCGAEIFTYFSARTENGINVGLFSTEVFAKNKPLASKERDWSVFVSDSSVEFQRAHTVESNKEVHVFRLKDFLVGKKFPVPF